MDSCQTTSVDSLNGSSDFEIVHFPPVSSSSSGYQNLDDDVISADLLTTTKASTTQEEQPGFEATIADLVADHHQLSSKPLIPSKPRDVEIATEVLPTADGNSSDNELLIGLLPTGKGRHKTTVVGDRHGFMIPMKCMSKGRTPPLNITSDRRDGLSREQAFRLEPLSKERYRQMFDREGRLISEHLFRQEVFKGGLEADLRREAWGFLFGLYPCHSTKKERDSIGAQSTCRYVALKRRWKQQLLKVYPTFDLNNYENFLVEDKPMFASNQIDDPSMCGGALNKDVAVQSIATLEAQIYANRFACSLAIIAESLRFVSKDVPRTDRTHPYFADESDGHLLSLRDGLVAFSVLHPEIGYVQGMNDLLGRFLIVFDDEAMAFWCFTYFIMTVQKDFLSEGMLQRIATLKSLLEAIDPDLHHYLHVCEAADMIFCHKWLLLSFQREFTMEEGLRLLEILSSHHVELSSLKGQTAIETYRSKIMQGVNVAGTEEIDYNFDLFVATAILVLNRVRIFKCADGSQIHQFISRLSQQLDLDTVLITAERLFYNFCKKSVVDSFVLID